MCPILFLSTETILNPCFENKVQNSLEKYIVVNEREQGTWDKRSKMNYYQKNGTEKRLPGKIKVEKNENKPRFKVELSRSSNNATMFVKKSVTNRTKNMRNPKQNLCNNSDIYI